MHDEAAAALAHDHWSISLDMVPFRQTLLQRLVVDVNAQPSPLLGLVQSKVRLRQQVQGADLVAVAKGYPDRRTDAEPDILPFDGLGQSDDQPAASASASPCPSTRSAITTNSSPPMRPTMSPVLTTPDRRAPTWRRIWSPVWWPYRSFACLKLSKSMYRTAVVSICRRAGQGLGLTR